jgi:hypothetical protein
MARRESNPVGHRFKIFAGELRELTGVLLTFSSHFIYQYECAELNDSLSPGNDMESPTEFPYQTKF